MTVALPDSFSLPNNYPNVDNNGVPVIDQALLDYIAMMTGETPIDYGQSVGQGAILDPQTVQNMMWEAYLQQIQGQLTPLLGEQNAGTFLNYLSGSQTSGLMQGPGSLQQLGYLNQALQMMRDMGLSSGGVQSTEQSISTGGTASPMMGNMAMAIGALMGPGGLGGLQQQVGGIGNQLSQLQLPNFSGVTPGQLGLDFSGLTPSSLGLDLSGLQSGLSGLQQGFGGLSAQLGALSGNLPDLSGLTGQVSGLSSGLSGLSSQLGSLQLPSLSGLTQGLGSLQTQLGSLGTQLSNFQLPSLGALPGQVSSLSQQIGNLGTPVNQLEGLVGRLEGLDFSTPQMPDYSQQLGNLSGMMSGIQQQLSGISGNVGGNATGGLPGFGAADLSSGLSNFFAGNDLGIGGLDAQLGNIGGMLSGLQTQVGNLTGLGGGGGSFDPQQLYNTIDDYFGIGPGQQIMNAAMGGGPDLSGITEMLQQLLERPAGGDTINSYTTGAGFDPVAFGRGLANPNAEDGWNYLNLGFKDVIGQALHQNRGLFGGGGLSPDALQQGLSQFFGGDNPLAGHSTFGLEELQQGLGGFFGNAENLGGFLDPMQQIMDQYFGGDRLQELIGEAIPVNGFDQFMNQIFSPDVLAQISERLTPDMVIDELFGGGAGDPASDFEGGAFGRIFGGNSIDEIEPPVLDLPEIMDYSGQLEDTLIPQLLEALGAPNPYDTRREALTAGSEAALARRSQQARDSFQHIAGLEGRDLGNPMMRQMLADMESQLAIEGLNIDERFAQQAAASDEPLRRNRLGDIASALERSFGRVQQQLGFQHALQTQANQDYLNFIEQRNRINAMPQGFLDEALRLALGGMGTSLQPNGAAALQGLGGVAGAYGNRYGGTMALGPALSNLFFQS